MITETEFLNAINVINKYKKQITEQLEKIKTNLVEIDFSHLSLDENTNVRDCGLSKRALHILLCLDIEKLGELKEFKKSDLLKLRNSGKVSINEIEKCLFQAGIVIDA